MYEMQPLFCKTLQTAICLLCYYIKYVNITICLYIRLATDSDFTIENAAKTIEATRRAGNHFTCTLKGIGKGRTKYDRAFVTYSNNLGIETTVYSNIICVTTK